MNESFQELTDSQGQVIAKIVDNQRQRWHSLRIIVNAILWVNYTGLQWRELNRLKGSPPWQTVYYYFRQFKRQGVWVQRLDSLMVSERKRQQREEAPSLVAIDSQISSSVVSGCGEKHRKLGGYASDRLHFHSIQPIGSILLQNIPLVLSEMNQPLFHRPVY
ncbi:transposase [Spirosoma humi]